MPSYDLDQARSLLLEFQNLVDVRGESIRRSYREYGLNWFPTVVNYLHGRIFMSYVKYRPLVDRMLEGEIEPIFENPGDFSRLALLLREDDLPGGRKAALFNLLIRWNNRWALRRRPAEILFFRFTPDDFRTRAAKTALDDLGARYLEAFGAERRLLLRSLLQGTPHYFYGGVPVENRFRCEYRLEGLDRHKGIVFRRAIDRIERMISGFIREFEEHLETLAATRIHTLYGIDDSQVIYPLLYACQERGIRTVAHQHGAAYNKRHASYVMEGIDRREYRWFDTLITWGEFWRDQLLAVSAICSPEQVVVGADLFGSRYDSIRRNGRRRRNILLPYEYLTNTYRVGRYIVKLIDLGYQIFFKPRADENLEAQIEAYCLPPDYQSRLTIVPEITPALLETIDIVAGTASTLVYQLLAHGKIIWVLETDYRYMDDLVEAGYAHRIRYEDLGSLEERSFVPAEVDPQYLFSPESLSETLSRHVVVFTGGRTPSAPSMGKAE